jgi:hypothetical protein
MEDKGSSLIQLLLSRLSWSRPSFHLPYYRAPEENIDDWGSRDKMKMIHLLARHGAKLQKSNVTLQPNPSDIDEFDLTLSSEGLDLLCESGS